MENEMHDWTQHRLDRRRLLRGAAGVALGASPLLAAACGGSSSSGGSSKKIVAKADGDLLFFNWAQYTDPKVISGFEKEYGVKVHVSNFDNMDAMMAKINAGVKYDVIFPENSIADKLVKGKLLAEIDHSQLKNWNEALPYFSDPWYDPGAKHTIPYALWTTGIGWRTDKVSGPMTGTWDDLWNHPDAKGKVWLLDDMREVLGMSLLRKGHDLNSTDKGQVDEATSEILKLMPAVRGFTSVNNQFIDGSGTLMHIWSGQVWQTISAVKNPEVYRFELPKGETPLNTDTVAIPKNAPHPGTALLFLDWILKPENVDANIHYMGYPQGTKQGLETYNTMTKQAPYLAIDSSTIGSAKHFEPLSPQELATWGADWTKVKAA
jgi:spermidine/putrescine transport system substrate-binding protein